MAEETSDAAASVFEHLSSSLYTFDSASTLRRSGLGMAAALKVRPLTFWRMLRKRLPAAVC